ncbi:MAG: type II toxin-antitoxin system HicA family toxin [Burkholderiaceae bacterium]
MSKSSKLLAKLLAKTPGLVWDEAVNVMKAHNFVVINRDGSGRVFHHKASKIKVLLHEPHPQNTLKPYMFDALIEGLKNAGEIKNEPT